FKHKTSYEIALLVNGVQWCALPFLSDELTEATDAAVEEITYFREQMATITSASDFLAVDRLVSFVLEAKGLVPDDV
ncbi:hypothetical protein ACCT11_36835, partial [Rhizobium johnstonii]|uniref:hypothetical protein n=1 Tax=Rhizobium johnstonii TaxID=3019933 RepID=UPI003F98F817